MNMPTEQVFLLNSNEIGPEGSNNSPETPQINLEDAVSSNVCRMCATVTEMVIPIFHGEGLENNLAGKIHKHLPIHVSVNDELPQVVCYQCATTLLAWHELVECCIQADAALKTRLTVQAAKIYRASSDIQEVKASTSDDAADSTGVDTDKLSVCDEKIGVGGSCAYCGLAGAGEAHLLRAHAERVFRCDECGALEDRRELVRHMSRHAARLAAAPRPAPPPRARRAFQRACPTCGKVYTVSSSYFYHVKYAHGGARVACGTCGRRVAAAGLAAHQRLHAPAREYACAACPRRFASRAGVHAHRAAHHAAERFGCEQCAAQFATRAGLRRHAARHAAERRWACACGARFAVRGDLVRHARTHSPRPARCPACPAAFAQRRYLAAHLQRKHRAAPAPAAPAAAADETYK